MMIEWNSFSAFDDARELEHVVDLLHDWADSGQMVSEQNPPFNRYDFQTGEKSHLWARLSLQAAETEKILEIEKPGLYPKTDIADNFYKLFFDLEDVAEKPFLLKPKLSDIVLRLHKALIYAHEVFNPDHLEIMLDKLKNDERVKASAEIAKAKNDERVKASAEIAKAKRDSQVNAATKSHEGRKLTREYTINQFMQKNGVWDSISHAAKDLEKEVVQYSSMYPRPLAPTNASRSIREWIGGYLRENPEAKHKISEKGQRLLK